MQKKLHIKKGDTVMVVAGNSRGQQGRVLEVVRKDYRAIVEGVNMVSKHTKPNQDNPQGGIVKKEAPEDNSYIVYSKGRDAIGGTKQFDDG